MIVAVDVGGTKTAVMVADGEERRTIIRPTNLRKLVPSLIAAIRDATNGKCIGAIGVGIPGMVNREAGTVELATNLGILQPLGLGEMLSAEFQCPVTLENDVRVAALAVHAQFQLPNIAYLSIGTGISAGIVLNDQLWRGANGMAGEVGHLCLDEDGRLFEHIAAGPAIVKQARDFDLRVKRASDVFRMAEEEPSADLVVERVCGAIGRMIQWLILSYDVEKVVLGGGVVQIGAAFADPLNSALAKLRSQSALNQKLLPEGKVAVLSADYNAGLHGAIALAAPTAHANSQ